MRRLLVGLAATALLGAAPAAAGTIQVGLGLHGGGLSVQAPAGASVAGRTVAVPLTLADARGSGAGWTLRISGGEVTITGVTARCAPGSTCTLPVLSGGGKTIQAQHDTGMGVMQLVVTVAPTGSGQSAVAFSVS